MQAHGKCAGLDFNEPAVDLPGDAVPPATPPSCRTPFRAGQCPCPGCTALPGVDGVEDGGPALRVLAQALVRPDHKTLQTPAPPATVQPERRILLPHLERSIRPCAGRGHAPRRVKLVPRGLVCRVRGVQLEHAAISVVPQRGASTRPRSVAAPIFRAARPWRRSRLSPRICSSA